MSFSAGADQQPLSAHVNNRAVPLIWSCQAFKRCKFNTRCMCHSRVQSHWTSKKTSPSEVVDLPLVIWSPQKTSVYDRVSIGHIQFRPRDCRKLKAVGLLPEFMTPASCKTHLWSSQTLGSSVIWTSRLPGK